MIGSPTQAWAPIRLPAEQHCGEGVAGGNGEVEAWPPGGGYQASTVARRPGDPRPTPRTPDARFPSRFLVWRRRAAPPFARRTRLIIVRSVVRIHPELSGAGRIAAKADWSSVDRRGPVEREPAGSLAAAHAPSGRKPGHGAAVVPAAALEGVGDPHAAAGHLLLVHEVRLPRVEPL